MTPPARARVSRRERAAAARSAAHRVFTPTELAAAQARALRAALPLGDHRPWRGPSGGTGGRAAVERAVVQVECVVRRLAAHFAGAW